MKKLLASTATALVLGTGAWADAHTMGIGTAGISAEDLFASDFIGMRLYALDTDIETAGGRFDAADGWEDIGEINDLVVSSDGEVPAAIIGVGGFLGIGEKDVAISMDRISVYTDDGGSRFLVISTTAEVLENAPAFEMDLDGDTEMADDVAETDVVETDVVETDVADTDMADTDVAETDLVDEPVVDGTVVATDETAEVDTMAETDVAEVAVQDSLFDRYSTVMAADITTDDLVGATVYDANEANVGEIGQLLVSADGAVEGAVIDVGGFIGLGEKPVLLSMDDLTILQEIDGDDLIVKVDMTEDQLDALPEYED